MKGYHGCSILEALAYYLISSSDYSTYCDFTANFISLKTPFLLYLHINTCTNKAGWKTRRREGYQWSCQWSKRAKWCHHYCRLGCKLINATLNRGDSDWFRDGDARTAPGKALSIICWIKGSPRNEVLTINYLWILRSCRVVEINYALLYCGDAESPHLCWGAEWSNK
jgi:hypothetical protein